MKPLKHIISCLFFILFSFLSFSGSVFSFQEAPDTEATETYIINSGVDINDYQFDQPESFKLVNFPLQFIQSLVSFNFSEKLFSNYSSSFLRFIITKQYLVHLSTLAP